jgi:hypothetical protein
MQTNQLRFFYVLIVVPVLSFGQNKEQGSMPTSLAPASAKRENSAHRIKETKFRKQKVRHTSRYEYYERKEEALLANALLQGMWNQALSIREFPILM